MSILNSGHLPRNLMQGLSQRPAFNSINIIEANLGRILQNLGIFRNLS